MEEEKKIAINLTDMYQFLIAECRYGYRRNNHLMPWGAYHHVKDYAPLMLKIDKQWALHTLEQLCDECISEQIIGNFYDGFDDEFGNRAEAIEFIKYLLDTIHNNGDENYYPYNYDQFLDNLAKDDEPIYNIYEVEYKEPYSQPIEDLYKGLPELGKKLNDKPLSRKEYLNYLFGTIIPVKENETIWYNKMQVKDDICSFIKPEAFRYRLDYLKRSFIVYANSLGGDKIDD